MDPISFRDSMRNVLEFADLLASASPEANDRREGITESKKNGEAGHQELTLRSRFDVYETNQGIMAGLRRKFSRLKSSTVQTNVLSAFLVDHQLHPQRIQLWRVMQQTPTCPPRGSEPHTPSSCAAFGFHRMQTSRPFKTKYGDGLLVVTISPLDK